MPGTAKSKSALATQAAATIFPNTSRQIDASLHQQLELDLIASFFNTTDDAGKVVGVYSATSVALVTGDNEITHNLGAKPVLVTFTDSEGWNGTQYRWKPKSGSETTKIVVNSPEDTTLTKIIILCNANA